MKMLILTLTLVLSSSAWAQMLKLADNSGKIFVPQQKGWELGKEMFGMPFIYFSPQVNGQRSNISFTATGADVVIDLANMGHDFAAYKKLKNEWAESVLAKPLGFSPYKSWRNSHGHDVHEVGFEFQHEEDHYFEKSYYINCTGRLIYAKSLRSKENHAHEKEFHSLVNELDCGAP